MKQAILIYSGSFDPFHNGHLEAIQIASKWKKKYNITKSIIFPNNPNKSKPNRTNLALRTKIISHYMPLYNSYEYLENSIQIVCDTRKIDIILEHLKQSFTIIGLVGSDITKVKWYHDKLFCVERINHKIPSDHQYHEVIALNNTKKQSFSSTFIRENVEKLNSFYVRETTISLIKKKTKANSLSENLIKIERKQNLLLKHFKNNNEANKYLINTNKWFKFCQKFLKSRINTSQCFTIDNNITSESYLEHDGNLLDILINCETDEILKIFKLFISDFLVIYYKLLIEENILERHNDLSVTNILYSRRETGIKFSIIDSSDYGTPKTRGEFDRFFGSIKYYLLLNGIEKINQQLFQTIVSFFDEKIK